MSNSLIPLTTQPGAIVPAAVLDSAREYVEASKSDNTRKTYASAYAGYAAFCAKSGHSPASVAACVHYLTTMADAGSKVSTIELHKSAISFMHGGRTGAHNPALSPEVRALMQGIGKKRAKRGDTKEQARPILLAELRQIVAACNIDTLACLRDRAIVLIGWFAALRRSEVAALNVRDLAFRDDALIVTLQTSKTDQSGKGYKIALPVLADKGIDPATAVRAWLDMAGIGSGPLFVRVDKWGHAGRNRINDKHIDSVIKRLAAAGNLGESDYRRISGHSLRAGFATEAARRGMPMHSIKQITRHKSDAILSGYIREGGAETMTTIRAIVGE
jgi:integrase